MTRSVTVHYATITETLGTFGLLARGGFTPEPADNLGDDARAVVLVGNAGTALWREFSATSMTGRDTMDRWTRRVLDGVATNLGARPVYPFGGPPWWPFQRWAQRAESVFPSPIGMLIHPEFGLWHAYRGALVFDVDVEGIPHPDSTASPCLTCRDKPCLSGCPVNAFGPNGYDVPGCADHLRDDAGRDCMESGCRARRACPVGREYIYLPEQAAFHMSAFLGSRPGIDYHGSSSRTG